MASILPLAEAKWRGVDPVVPTIGVDESRPLSFEYFLGSLSVSEGVSQDDQSPRTTKIPGSIDVCTVVDKQFDDLHIST
jgi:hypothetical protein